MPAGIGLTIASILILAVTRFHMDGSSTTLQGFWSKKVIPVYTANHLQRWALRLLLYNFDNEFRLLSRQMSAQRRPDEDYVMAAVHVESEAKAVLDDSISSLPVAHHMIMAETRKDPVLQQTVNFLQECWPAHVKQFEDLVAKN